VGAIGFAAPERLRDVLYLGMAVGSALAFTVGGVFMKRSHGLTRPWPTLALLELFVVGAVLLTLSINLRGELGAAYLVVLGLEAVLAFTFGTVLFGEHANAGRVLGLALLVAGLILIERDATPTAPPVRPPPAVTSQAGHIGR
jgi:small multidrug resistance pump/quaternary ammonium compound-resistance protein SugE